MTTIAFDGTTLAADRGSWSDGAIWVAKKVFKVSAPNEQKFLVGFCGDAILCAAILRWMRGERSRPTPQDYVKNEDLNYVICIVINEKREIYAMGSRSLDYQRQYNRIGACGAGQLCAIGAMAAGATAREAVLIAQKWSDYAANGVDCVRF